MGLSKYVKAPVSGNIARYTDEELRKLEKVLDNILADFAETQDMSLIETGNFIPVVEGLTTAGAGTYSIQEGQFYKIGRFVIVQFRVVTSAHTGTGQAVVKNLPFSAKIIGTAHAVTDVYSDTNNVAAGLISSTDPSRLRLFQNIPRVAFNITGTMDFIVNMQYITN